MRRKITKKIRVNFIRHKLRYDSVWSLKALLVIYSKQTESEKNKNSNIEYNGVGFTSPDAKILTPIARKHLYNVTKKSVNAIDLYELNIVKRIMPKYSRQMLKFTNIEKLDHIITVEYMKNSQEKQERPST